MIIPHACTRKRHDDMRGGGERKRDSGKRKERKWHADARFVRAAAKEREGERSGGGRGGKEGVRKNPPIAFIPQHLVFTTKEKKGKGGGEEGRRGPSLMNF